MTSLYDTAVRPIVRTLNNLSHILEKAEHFADEKNIPHSDFLEARLAPDMHPLPFQIQTASNTAKNLSIYVGGAKDVAFADNEKTFSDLQARIMKTITYLKALEREDFNGREKHEFVAHNLPFNGLSYVNGVVLPNFYFHAVTTYSILRMKGVDLGKNDWLGTPKL